jgi:hypothetical protein
VGANAGNGPSEVDKPNAKNRAKPRKVPVASVLRRAMLNARAALWLRRATRLRMPFEAAVAIIARCDEAARIQHLHPSDTVVMLKYESAQVG